MPLSMVTLPCLCVDGKLLKIELEKGQFWPEQGNSEKKVCQFVIQIMRDGGVFCAGQHLGPTLTVCRGVTMGDNDLKFLQELGLGPCSGFHVVLLWAAKAPGRGSVFPEGSVSWFLLHCSQTPDSIYNSRVGEGAPGQYLPENVNHTVVH